MSELYQQNRQALWDHCSSNHNLLLLESETFELWQVATQSCRAEIVRLERLVSFHMRGRQQDAEQRNQAANSPAH